MGIVSPYTLLKYIDSYSRKELIENQLPGKQIPSRNQIPSRYPRVIEDKKVKEVCTYADIVSEGTAIY